MVLRALHLCSGYGGFELALRLAGIPARTVAHVERDSYAAATLVARMEEAHLDQAPVWSDLATFDAQAFAGRVDLVTAGLPCQPFSGAGKRRGLEDERHLWPHARRIIAEVGCRFVLLENVRDVVRAGWLAHVLADLADLGFDAEWGLLSAADVGAPHERKRFWLLAHSDGDGLRWLRRQPADDREPRHDADRCCPPGADVGTAWPPTRDDHAGWARYLAEGGPEPAIRRGPDGRPPELADSLHLGGNGLIPAVAAHALVTLADRLGVDLWAGAR